MDSGIQKVLFPGILAGILCLILFTSLVATNAPVAAAGLPDPAPVAAAPTNAPKVAAQPDGASAQNCGLHSRFPDSVRRWCDLIEKTAQDAGLDPNLVAAVMLQESGGNPDAYSKSGAVGLLQVMPRDGIAAGFQCVNGPCFGSRPSMAELTDPEYNLRFGTRMLAGLVQKRGSVRDALRSYGPANIGYYYADKVLGIFEAYQ